MTIVIGLTGGIGSGKSTVSQMFAELGAAVIDADKTGHEAFLRGTDAYREIVSVFGAGVLKPDDQEIDRGKLAQIVFKDPQALQRLNNIMHPRMHRVMELKLADLRRKGAAVVVLEAALLLEAKWTDLVDQVWVVAAPEETVVRRLRLKGFTKEHARARIKSQMSLAARIKQADQVINNDRDLDEVRKQVKELWDRLCSARVSGK